MTTSKTKGNFLNLDVYGFPLWVFLLLLVVLYVSMTLGLMTLNLANALFITFLLGAVCYRVGDNIPFMAKYLGGGTFLIIFGLSFLKYVGILPEAQVALVRDFAISYQYVNFITIGMVVGSILGMRRELLVKSGVKFFIPLVAGVIAAFLSVGLIGQLLGYGFANSILYVAAPIMGGGMASGAIPMASIYNITAGLDVDTVLATVTPIFSIGNIIAIIAASILNGLGKRKPELSGEGQLMDLEKMPDVDPKEMMPKKVEFRPWYGVTGVIGCIGIYKLGEVIMYFTPTIHAFVWAIVICMIIKIFGLFPEDLEDRCSYACQQLASEWIIPCMACVGIVFIDFGVVIDVVTNPVVFILCIVCIVVVVVVTGFVGRLVGFNFIESSITSGLCMANAGGGGDVATLQASDRMDLLPFATVSSRVGGGLILVIMSFLTPILANLIA